MKTAVLSGKGGAGKTMVAVNLSAVTGHSVYVDCDVEEPNGRLFFHPEGIETEEVFTLLPEFDMEKCTGCRACTDFCRFNAIVYIRGKMKLFDEVCHSCGGCKLVCPEKAVSERKNPIGVIETGVHGDTKVVTGILNLGEASGVPVISQALKKGYSLGENVIVDCPPGSACSVMESVTDADYCILVAEPTAFGFHNFRMVYELVSLLKKPCGVVINKMNEPYEPLETFCREEQIPVLLRIPYDRKFAELGSAGKILVEKESDIRAMFTELSEKIGGVLS